MTESLMGYTAKIAPELQSFARPITDPKVHPENVRKHNIEKIAQSLEAHGQRALIIVQASTGLIVKGNGTFTAAQLLGWGEVAQSWQEMDDSQAMAFLLADNRASDLATYDRKKLRDGLAKLAADRGFFDSLWTEEELADIEDDLAGATVIETESKAEFATKDGEAIKHERAALPGEKQREVPLVMSIADHEMFMGRIAILQKAFGTGGRILTIMEAVKRQAEMESGGPAATGKALTEDESYTIKRDVVKEIRDYFTTVGGGPFTATQIAARLESIVPYRDTATTLIAEGQVGLFDDVPPSGVDLITTAGAPVPEGMMPSDHGDFLIVNKPLENMVEPEDEKPTSRELGNAPDQVAEYEAEQAEALARYRKSQPA